MCFSKMMPKGKKIKILLDADVLKAASWSCNLAKSMPAVLNAKPEYEKREKYSKSKSTWHSKANKNRHGRLSMLKSIIKIWPCFSFFTDVGFEQSPLCLTRSEMCWKESEGSELGSRLCSTTYYMTPNKSLSLSDLRNVDNIDPTLKSYTSCHWCLALFHQ